MEIKKIKIGKKVVWPFTIPSGIVTTHAKCLEKLAREVPFLDIITTKSIGPEQRAGNREPILSQYMPQGFLNAVGLTNPGAEEFARQLSGIAFPPSKFLLASIFGKNVDEFVYVAKTLENLADGFELNLSCPHAKGYGMVLGQDSEIVEQITRAVCQITKKPVIAKLTPNTGNNSEIARAAMRAGAYGLSLINTVGPGYWEVDGNPVLTNKVGGLSGAGILPIGLKCVREVREAVGKEPLIIGMGGIATAKDAEAYNSAGANVFGIGSALAGMPDSEIKEYFTSLAYDLSSGENTAASFLRKVDMNYRKVRVENVEDLACDFKVIRTDGKIDAEPGQFVFAWIPGVGEKPFSVMDDDPLTLGILERGQFTRAINSLKAEDGFYVRGPYGRELMEPVHSRAILVGGGCGVAGLYLSAKRLGNHSQRPMILLGAKDKHHIPYLKEFRTAEFLAGDGGGDVRIATEDGSLGIKGSVLDLLKSVEEGSFRGGRSERPYFYNCGPRAMIEAVLPFELAISSPDRVYSSIDYMTSCGVGICGKCADDRGRRTCVEGPFMRAFD